MKKLNFTTSSAQSIIAFLLSFLLLFVSFWSCNKSDISSRIDQDMINAKKEISQSIDKDGVARTVIVNQPVKTFYTDKNGKEISIAEIHRIQENSRTSNCDYSNQPSATLTSITYMTSCISGNKLQFTYRISTNNNIVAVNSVIPTLKTKGLLRIYSSSNTLSYSEDITTVTIQDKGADPAPNQSGYELFDVSFTSSWISNQNYFNPIAGYVIKLGATCATDCPDGEAFPIAILPYTPTVQTGPIADPCIRIDQVFMNGVQPYFSGGYSLISCPANWVYPNIQEIRYSTDGGVTWTETGLTCHSNNGTMSNFNNLANKGYINASGASVTYLVLPKGTYTFLFQERNIKYNSSVNLANPWPLPTTSNSCIGAWGTMPVSYNGTQVTY